jgi:hypothetical protein
MNNLMGIIDQLYFKIQNLIHLHQNLNKEFTVLKNINVSLLEKIKAKDLLIGELTEKNTILKLGSRIEGAEMKEPTQDVKLKINELVREIDYCIAQLNS